MVAVGFGVMVTLTVAVALGHGDVPVTVYVYVPEAAVAGFNVPRYPPVVDEGPLHVPVVPGVPPNDENKLNEDAPAQEDTVPFVPALAVLTTVTAAVAKPEQPQEFVADKVYV